MEAIRALPPNGLKVVSTFSGCGGSCLGFKMAGYRVLYAVEFVEAARDTYLSNFPDVQVDDRDVRLIKPEEILSRIGMKVGELDVLEGSPPCASFSTAGKREAGWGEVKTYSDTKQRTDDLFFEYVRILVGLKPRAFVAENVSGLVKGVAKGYFKEIFAALQGAGYRVQARMLNAQWCGVPQSRQRVIFQGVREDLELDPAFPDPLPYWYSVRDALPGLKVVHDTSGDPSYSAGDVTDRPSPAVTVGINSINSYHFKVTEDPSIERFAIGREALRLREGETSDRYFNLVKPDREKPCPTVTATGGVMGAASVIHPSEPRKFTIAELRRICSFPDDFVLTGSFQQQWERLGRSVPPLMMKRVAEALRDGVLLKGGNAPACAGSSVNSRASAAPSRQASRRSSTAGRTTKGSRAKAR
jgi:DNA (cytosine-5)-methyltransferase 1